LWYDDNLTFMITFQKLLRKWTNMGWRANYCNKKMVLLGKVMVKTFIIGNVITTYVFAQYALLLAVFRERSSTDGIIQNIKYM